MVSAYCFALVSCITLAAPSSMGIVCVAICVVVGAANRIAEERLSC